MGRFKLLESPNLWKIKMYFGSRLIFISTTPIGASVTTIVRQKFVFNLRDQRILPSNIWKITESSFQR